MSLIIKKIKIKIIMRKTDIENMTIPSVDKDIAMRTLTYYWLDMKLHDYLGKVFGSFLKKLNIHLFI